MVKESSFSKFTWIGVGALMFGFLEPLGRSLYEGATTILPPYLISILFGIVGVSFIVYDYISRKRRFNDDEKWRFFPART